jgi:selenocysteine lyase/cysteine desulfurase
MNSLEQYFEQFRENIIGVDLEYDFLGGRNPVLYADWAASGRLYRPIEHALSDGVGPYIANTHTETTSTGRIMTDAYHQARDVIKQHVGASEEDILLFAGFGMTAVINKFQRILGLRVPEQHRDELLPGGSERPLVILTHMEHHSNQTTWEECLCDVEIINRGSDGLPDLSHLKLILDGNRGRTQIIGSFTACSNVTGLITPYHRMAELIHDAGGFCFIDFAAGAPYLRINMHPEDERQALDAVFFSPHKFLGGPGSSGVIVFNKKLYHRAVPDHPGGGTVAWTNPWGGHRFFDDIEIREDGGTPGVLQAIKAALSVSLKEDMNTARMLEREHELKGRLMDGLESIPSIRILEPDQKDRIGYVSFYSDDVHYNLFVRLLNDRFGIQIRGGCSCAGTYGHILLHIGSDKSKEITDLIDSGDLSLKPGWARISLHPTMRDDEVEYMLDAVRQVVASHKTWADDYRFNASTGDFHSLKQVEERVDIRECFGSKGQTSRRP